MIRIIFIPLALALSYPALSAETRPYMYRVQQTQQLQELINRGSVPVTYETVATTPQGQQVTRYTTRSTALTTSRLGSIARSATGGPAILAATAAFVAYDYFFDEDTETWMVAPSELPDDPIPGSVCQPRAGAPITSDVSVADCWEQFLQYETGNVVSNWLYRKYTTQQDYIGYCVSSPSGSPSCRNSNYFRVPVSSDMGPDIITQPVPSPATDSQLGDAVKLAPPQAVTDILNDPISTGTWPDRWPELLPNVQDIEDQLGHDIEGAPAPANPDQTITDGSTVAPPQTDTGSGGSMSTEWPTFCSWAGVVCDFIDWVQEPFEEPEPVEVPYVEFDFEEDYDSGIGIPNCPAPISIVTQFGEVQFDWTNTCSLADMVRPLVIAFSYLIGIYILLRVK